ncbi:MAG: hypothetical protein HYU64_07095 [Armatimonadetes bacterium]|nr:hypothetical protein [Armatimonadota bacterium]
MAGLLDQVIKPITLGGGSPPFPQDPPPNAGGTSSTGPATGAGPNPSTAPPPLSPTHPDFVHGLVPQQNANAEPQDKVKLSGIAKLLQNNPSQELLLGEIVGP